MTIFYTVSSLDLPHQDTAVVRAEMPATQMSAWLPTAYQEVFGYLQHVGATPAGPPFARFTFLGDTVAVEAGAPVTTPVSGDGRVEASALPAGPAAVTTHVGRYEDLDKAVEGIHDWLATHRLEAVGPHWEIYYTDPNSEPDPSRWRTDVVVPYRAAAR